MRWSLLCVLVFCSVFNKSMGQLRCYACGFSSVDTDRSCLTISDSTPIVECSQTYCTIMRQEFIDPSGVVASFLRGCENSPDFINHEIIDPTFKTYYRACTSSLCNIGNGMQSVGGGNLSPIPEYTGLNLLVPGTSAAHTKIINYFIIFSVLSVLLFM